MLNDRLCLFPRHGRKLAKEFLQSRTRQVIEQILHRYASSHKHGGAAEDVGVAVHWGFEGGHESARFARRATGWRECELYIGLGKKSSRFFGRLLVGHATPASSEYTANVLNGTSIGTGPSMGNAFFPACYIEALCLLTGESRTWNNKTFFFNRVQPKRPLRLKRSEDCGDGPACGAWEVGVRYTYVDLSNKGIQAGRLDAMTAGVNWYLNANAKIQFNCDLTHRGDTANAVQGTIHAFGTRLAFDF